MHTHANARLCMHSLFSHPSWHVYMRTVGMHCTHALLHICLNRILILDLHACMFRMMVRTTTTPTSKGLPTRPRLGRERVNALQQRWCWRRGNREKGGQGGADGALRCRLGLNRCVCVRESECVCLRATYSRACVHACVIMHAHLCTPADRHTHCRSG